MSNLESLFGFLDFYFYVDINRCWNLALMFYVDVNKCWSILMCIHVYIFKLSLFVFIMIIIYIFVFLLSIIKFVSYELYAKEFSNIPERDAHTEAGYLNLNIRSNNKN